MTIPELAELVNRHYVFPEVAGELRDLLLARHAAGAYAGLDDAGLARAVTADLQSVNADKHLRLLHHEHELPERLEDEEVAMRQMGDWADATNHGIARVERLAGNVGLLQVKPIIFPAPIAAEAYAGAMTLLSTSDALVVDLRECLGGEVGMTAVLLSYFFGAEPVELSGTYHRRTDRVHQSWTVPHVAGRRFGVTKPVYVLTSGVTFSGGEAVAYDLKHTGRATVIGEQTRGGAHPRDAFRVGPHLEATIPVARSVSPVTGGNWEGTGVTPDVAVPAPQALETAHQLALGHVITLERRHTLAEALAARQPQPTA